MRGTSALALAIVLFATHGFAAEPEPAASARSPAPSSRLLRGAPAKISPAASSSWTHVATQPFTATWQALTSGVSAARRAVRREPTQAEKRALFLKRLAWANRIVAERRAREAKREAERTVESQRGGEAAVAIAAEAGDHPGPGLDDAAVVAAQNGDDAGGAVRAEPDPGADAALDPEPELAGAAGVEVDPRTRGQEPPSGFAGRPQRIPSETRDDFIPIEDRWRIGMPQWDRYPKRPGEYPYQRGHWWDPYNQNLLKGDYPILPPDKFLVFSLISDTLFEPRRIPTPIGVSAADRGRTQEFFGQSDQLLFNQNLVLSVEFFQGNTAFKPRDWEFRFTPVLNVNYLDAGEANAVNINSAEGATRTDGHVGVQELFFEYHVRDLSPWYDFVSTRTGIQGFTSDFRGFIFSDNNLGFRVFGNWESNRQQYNLAYFRPLEKDTNSGLNRLFVNDAFDSREEDVVVANWFRQDTFWYGYTTQFSFHWNGDHADHLHYDNNRFITRPEAIGDIVRGVGILSPDEIDQNDPNPPVRGTPVFHDVDAFYLGWAGEGHIGRLNVSHAFYEVLGRDQHNPIAGRKTEINAQLAALELSVDRDWLRARASFFWASGDPDPTDDTARGFDTILDNMNFAGAGFSYWNRQGIPLATTRATLVNRFSLLPSLRSSKIEGQPNFVNPGLFLYNIGADLELTPRLRAILNLNYLQFAETKPLVVLLQQQGIDRDIGFDYSIGLQYRPLLIDNVIVVASAAALTPMMGFRDVFVGETLYSTFLAVTLAY
ncbi:MAG: hypothetical protein QOD06_363 [Candidatus Binatota bacterium]|nr:hypothetical protein [Candidatus Binatota bacterium]